MDVAFKIRENWDAAEMKFLRLWRDREV